MNPPRPARPHGDWARRKVFVTGHTGFMGGWLSLWLADMGAEVTGYALPAPTEPSFFDATGLARRLRSEIADIRDLDTLAAAMGRAEPEYVFHLAAQPLVREAYRDPVTTFSTNVLGTVHLLEAVRRVKSVRAVVIVTSDKVYENREWVYGYRESDALGGREPYGASKAAAEIAVEAYRASYFGAAGRSEDAPPGVATVRAGNVFGGGDFAAERLIPDAVRAFGQKTPLLIRHPDAVRPWQHVLEPIAGYLALAARLADDPAGFAGAWNFGPDEDDAKPVGQIADTLAALWGDGAAWRPANDAGPYEAKLLAVTSAKARARLGWAPRWGLTRGLEETVTWYRAWMRDGRALEPSIEQIARFAEAA